MAMSGGGEQQNFSLTDYVKLSCMSPDSLFTSKTVRALVAQNLCTPILLGLPFLTHNHIIIDHAECTCVSKNANYDLLNPPEIHDRPTEPKEPRDYCLLKYQVIAEL
jgi:hypothetical protein